MRYVMTPQVVPESWSCPVELLEDMVDEVVARGWGWVGAPCMRWPKERP